MLCPVCMDQTEYFLRGKAMWYRRFDHATVITKKYQIKRVVLI